MKKLRASSHTLSEEELTFAVLQHGTDYVFATPNDPRFLKKVAELVCDRKVVIAAVGETTSVLNKTIFHKVRISLPKSAKLPPILFLDEPEYNIVLEDHPHMQPNAGGVLGQFYAMMSSHVDFHIWIATNRNGTVKSNDPDVQEWWRSRIFTMNSISYTRDDRAFQRKEQMAYVKRQMRKKF